MRSNKKELLQETTKKSAPSLETDVSFMQGVETGAEVQPLTKTELKQAIKELPEPAFNNPEKAQPKVNVQTPVSSTLKPPIIAGFNGVDDKDQKLIDPGMILTKPGRRIEKFQTDKISKKSSIIKGIFKYAKPHSYLIFIAFFCSIINSALELLIPILIGKGIDVLIGHGAVDFHVLGKIILWLAVSAVVFAVFKWLTDYTSNLLSYKTAKSMRDDLFKKFNQVPIKYIDGTSQGDLQSRMINDVEQITDGFLVGLTTFFDSMCTIVMLLVVLFTMSVPIAGAIIGLTPISLIVTTIIVNKTYKHFKQQAKALGDASGHIAELLGNQRVVTSFNYENKSVERFDKLNETLANYSEKSMFYSSTTNPCARFVNGVIYGIVAIMGTMLAIKGTMSIGSISTLLLYANKYIKPFNDVSDVITELQTAFASARRVFNVLSIENEPNDKEFEYLEKCDGRIEIKDASFSYVPSKPLIEGLSVKVAKGQRVAIVGPTGCGKSTLINLLMRFYDIKSGDIKISDKSIYKIRRASLRNKFGMVLQDTWLFSASIRDNIAYGKQDATEEEIIKAAKLAHAHDFISTLDKGYDTLVSENGDNLSQGQRQLLCIARIMLTKPPMLILDEATSNIDTRTELLIQEAFNKMMQGRTSFVVAHRLSTIVKSDIILVMNKGNIIEQGSHDELIEKKGFYFALYNSQFSKN